MALDPRLTTGSASLAALELCDARLQLDARYPWIVLIPRRDGLRELEDLDASDLAALMRDVLAAGAAVRAIGAAAGRPVEKLNVGALGNIVPQLHVHVVGRRSDDAAWPGPVWGHGEAEAYAQPALADAITAATASLSSRTPRP